jgi:hypothetical protein
MKSTVSRKATIEDISLSQGIANHPSGMWKEDIHSAFESNLPKDAARQ